jgi:putative flavoprotein involved in K+ transport
MNLPTKVETVVIGAGHSGLIMSSVLGGAGRDHVVLERRASLGGGWQDRWDEFCLVSPNWTASLPGMPYDGPDPDGFMPRDEIVARIARYADVVGAPVSLETEVRRVAPGDHGRFRVETTRGDIAADNVVVAAGSFHAPRVPPIAAAFPSTVDQLHSHDYRRETSLAPGAVLVVGSGQSGVQIAEELHEAGRDVYLSVGSAGRMPRRYRGSDMFRWLQSIAQQGARYGVSLPTRDKLPSPKAKFVGNPHLSGRNGGHDTNLREFAMRGMTLLGRIDRVEGQRLVLVPDLPDRLAAADRFFRERFQPDVERFIELAGIAAPPDDRRDATFDPPVLADLRLDEAGISTVIWTTGYRLDYGWIDFPIRDEDGYPNQQRGVTDVPGLYFLGLMWQSTLASATLFGPKVDSLHLASVMGLPIPEAPPAPVA